MPRRIMSVLPWALALALLAACDPVRPTKDVSTPYVTRTPIATPAPPDYCVDVRAIDSRLRRALPQGITAEDGRLLAAEAAKIETDVRYAPGAVGRALISLKMAAGFFVQAGTALERGDRSSASAALQLADDQWKAAAAYASVDCP